MNGQTLALLSAAGLAGLGLASRVRDRRVGSVAGSRGIVGTGRSRADTIALLLQHGATVRSYRDLDPAARASLADYCGTHGGFFSESPARWSTKPTENDRDHGRDLFLRGELPTPVATALAFESLEKGWPDFPAYHAWYLANDRVPTHGPKNRWPSIVSGDPEDEFFWDGWHRFHSYVRDGHPTVPVILPLRRAEGASRGSRALARPRPAERLAYTQETLDHEVRGIVADSVWAFNHIAQPMMGRDYWSFLGVDGPNTVKKAEAIIAAEWWRIGRQPLTTDEDFGRAITKKDRVFAWDTLYVQRDRRGAGLGRSIVERIESMFRKDGIRAVILQAGQLDLGFAPSSERFWIKMGYRVWPGEYEVDDRIMFKVLS